MLALCACCSTYAAHRHCNPNVKHTPLVGGCSYVCLCVCVSGCVLFLHACIQQVSCLTYCPSVTSFSVRPTGHLQVILACCYMASPPHIPRCTGSLAKHTSNTTLVPVSFTGSPASALCAHRVYCEALCPLVDGGVSPTSMLNCLPAPPSTSYCTGTSNVSTNSRRQARSGLACCRRNSLDCMTRLCS